MTAGNECMGRDLEGSDCGIVETVGLSFEIVKNVAGICRIS
jgi:hypothetical protein